MLEKIIRDFMTIWTTVDPITNLALFASLTSGMHRSERRRIAWRASLYAAIVLVVAVIIGQMAVFPLAVPAIAGPGAIMAIILLTDNDIYSVSERAETAVVLLVVLVLNYILLLLSDVILRIIGRQGAAVLTRVMGIILTALSVEFVLAGLSIGSWATPHH